MAALLRLAAMLVSNAVRPLRMLLTRLPRECHTDVMRDRLPAAENGKHHKETPAATTSQSLEGLMVSRPQGGRPSNQEAGLTRSLTPSFPGKARSAASRGETRSVERFERQWDRRVNAQVPTSNNRDSRDAALRALPWNDVGCCCAIHPGPRL
ncbi:MAG TPA: hypothetical protein VFV70_02810 [Hyphomonadaceae bacterium]|nr:hypothetical protein [Hyphomonadaceae bacterium]